MLYFLPCDNGTEIADANLIRIDRDHHLAIAITEPRSRAIWHSKIADYNLTKSHRDRHHRFAVSTMPPAIAITKPGS